MDFNFLPTGIGSLPGADAAKATQLVLKSLSEIPFWPQLPMRSFCEGMGAQFSQGLPALVVDTAKKELYIDTAHPKLDTLVTAFYERYLANDLPTFAISKEFAAGWHEILAQIKSKKPTPLFLKGQITGPLTFGALVTDQDGEMMMYHPLLADVLTKQLIMKARWQIRTTKALGLKSIIFLDEPFLMGFGSAFVSLSKEKVISQITEIIDAIHNEGALAGLHCCGNTDWGVLLQTPLDILNFDAYGFMDKLMLYSDAVKSYIDRGGVIAWGIVPSIGIEKVPSASELVTKLNQGIDELAKKGVNKDKLMKQALVTPSCGLGGLFESQAEERLKLLTEVFSLLR